MYEFLINLSICVVVFSPMMILGAFLDEVL